jgi:hypothetical protein
MLSLYVKLVPTSPCPASWLTCISVCTRVAKSDISRPPSHSQNIDGIKYLLCLVTDLTISAANSGLNYF